MMFVTDKLNLTNLSAFQKGTMYKLCNRLPITIQSLKEDRISFKNKLSLYLMNNSFHTVSKYVEYYQLVLTM
jgi:hypothetical protein